MLLRENQLENNMEILPISHCNLLHRRCDPIDNSKEKSGVQFIWNLMNSNTILIKRVVKYSLSMSIIIVREIIK